MKICLDAGHGEWSNRSPANSAYYEGARMFNFQRFLKADLEEYGFEVICTRNTVADDPSLYERGTMAKGCAVLLSLHSNAVGNEQNDDVDYVRVYYPVSRKEQELAQKLSEAIAAVMETRQSPQYVVRWNSAHNADYYGVIRHAVSVGVPGMILEHSFHTNARITNWLLRDENLKKLAAREAAVLADHYGMKKPEASVQPAETSDSATTETTNAGATATEKRYELLGDVTEDYYRPTVDKLLRLGYLRGRGGEGESLILDLGEDALRLLVMLDRAGLFD